MKQDIHDLAESIAFDSKRSLQNQRVFPRVTHVCDSGCRRRAGYLWMALATLAIAAGIIAMWLRYVN